MVEFRKILFCAAALAAGCAAGPDDGAAISCTPEIEVLPSNGTWDAEYGKTQDPANCSFVFSVARYRDGIGVKAKVRDDTIVTDGCKPGDVAAPTWDDDNIECFFDGDNDKSKDARSGNGLFWGGEYAFTANGAAQSSFSGQPGSFGTLWTGSVQRVEAPGGGWLLEYDLKFSWKCLGRAAPPPDGEDVTFGFNICVHDDDDGGRADRALFWKGKSVMPYRDESGFGEITLKGRKEEQ